MKFSVIIRRTELIEFHVEADTPDDAEALYLMDGDEINSRTKEIVVVSVDPATDED